MHNIFNNTSDFGVAIATNIFTGGIKMSNFTKALTKQKNDLSETEQITLSAGCGIINNIPNDCKANVLIQKQKDGIKLTQREQTYLSVQLSLLSCTDDEFDETNDECEMNDKLAEEYLNS